MFKWKLDRPLAVLDIEATGITPRFDRIVELAVVRIMPDNSRPERVWRLNPGIPIPGEVTDIHGISDADVANCPSFRDVADDILEFLRDCDLAGFNLIRYDIPMLAEECLRADKAFSIDDRRIIDAQRIFHQREPRDLSAALSFYSGEMHLDAHGARSDVLATIRVMEGQFERYSDLPQDLNALHEYCCPRKPNWVDQTGKLKWVNGEIALNFGKRKGALLRELVKQDPGFIKWMLRSDFPRDTQQIVTDATNNKWPQKRTS